MCNPRHVSFLLSYRIYFSSHVMIRSRNGSFWITQQKRRANFKASISLGLGGSWDTHSSSCLLYQFAPDGERRLNGQHSKLFHFSKVVLRECSTMNVLCWSTRDHPCLRDRNLRNHRFTLHSLLLPSPKQYVTQGLGCTSPKFKFVRINLTKINLGQI